MPNFRQYSDGMARVGLDDVEYVLFCPHTSERAAIGGSGNLTMCKDLKGDIVAIIFSCDECVKKTEKELEDVDDLSEVVTVETGEFFMHG